MDLNNITFLQVFRDDELRQLLYRWLQLNRWGVIFVIFLTSLSSVIYINNVININSTLTEIRQLERRKEDISNKNKLLESRLESLKSPERINYIAIEKMGMVKSKNAPRVLQ